MHYTKTKISAGYKSGINKLLKGDRKSYQKIFNFLSVKKIKNKSEKCKFPENIHDM